MSLQHPFSTKATAVSANGSTPAPPGGISAKVLKGAVERALDAQQPAVAGYIGKIRRDHPDATPAEVIAKLGKYYMLAVGGTGAAAGTAAFVPGLGTAASLATASAEAIAALDASVLYTLAVAEVHGVPMGDRERRKALVLAIVLGEGGDKLMRKVTGRSNEWAHELADSVPLPKIGPLNQTLVRWFIRRYARRQIAQALGRALPLGAGAVVGALTNVGTARAVIRSAERAFGPPPADWAA